MKRILSLALAAAMTMSVLPVAYAADTQDYTQGTQVSYTAANAESYTITVPAKLAPGDTGTVTAKGTWPSTKNLRVTADESIEMVNSISAASNKELDITFEPIVLKGSQTAEVSATSDITVENITDALFGTWSGTINYNAGFTVTVGDLDNDGSLTMQDTSIMDKLLSGQTTTDQVSLVAADTNGDKVINLTDLEILTKKIGGVPVDSAIIYTPQDYIANSEYTVVRKIMFKIDGTTYFANEGMTWSEWIADDYCNCDSYQIFNDTKIGLSENEWVYLNDQATGAISPNDVIVKGTKYLISE